MFGLFTFQCLFNCVGSDMMEYNHLQKQLAGVLYGYDPDQILLDLH